MNEPLSNLIVAGFKLLFPLCRVSFHSSQPLGQLVNLGPEVIEVPVLGCIRTAGHTTHFRLWRKTIRYKWVQNDVTISGTVVRML